MVAVKDHYLGADEGILDVGGGGGLGGEEGAVQGAVAQHWD